jgi:hypothetical protein
MMAFIVFIGVTAILLLEGMLLARILLRTNWWLATALALPFASLVNVLITFVWTIVSVPLTPLSLIGTHLLATLILGIYCWKKTAPVFDAPVQAAASTPSHITLTALCIILLAMISLYSFAHAILLPTFQYDSATNWTMRSQISFVNQRIAFDPTEERGMAKPQYPFLFHALQITANQGQRHWNDTAANAGLFLLSIGSFASIAMILARRRTRLAALVTTTLIIGIPLLSLHLAQGYADLNLVQALLLSMSCFAIWMESKESTARRWLIGSAFFVAAAVWTKSEGVIVGLLPWLFLIGMRAMKERSFRKDATIGAAVALGLSLPWEIFALAKGLLLTPHSSDTAIGFHPEGISEAFFGLMSRGSFGITWYVLPVMLMLLFVLKQTQNKLFSRTQQLLLVWGGIVFFEMLFIYLCTPNVRFLLNAESYYRQMMVPAAMLLLACGWCFDERGGRVS